MAVIERVEADSEEIVGEYVATLGGRSTITVKVYGRILSNSRHG